MRRDTAIDWAAVEVDYRSGRLSLRELGEKHGCSHSTIANFASRHAWSRNACERGAVEEGPERSRWLSAPRHPVHRESVPTRIADGDRLPSGSKAVARADAGKGR